MESLFSWRGWRSREKSLCILSLDNYKSDGVWVQRPVGCKDSLWRLSDEVVYFFIITNCLRHREENTAVSEQQIQVTFLTETVCQGFVSGKTHIIFRDESSVELTVDGFLL